MSKEFVVAVCDVRCIWDDVTISPRYRCYVNDELFTERTWIWTNEYLEESIQILAPPGKYHVHYQLVDPENATISSTNLRIIQGPAVLSPDGSIHIYMPKR